jgi:hypothetical protein
MCRKTSQVSSCHGAADRGGRFAEIMSGPPTSAGKLGDSPTMVRRGRASSEMMMATAFCYWYKGAPSGIVGPVTMRNRSCNGKRPDVLAVVLLAALLFRAYVPVGFMPASGTPFLLEMCPAAYPTSAPAQHSHHSHSQGHGDFQNCPFGSAPAAGPVSHLIAFEPPGRIASFLGIPTSPRLMSTQPLRAHQPRGPPSPA